MDFISTGNEPKRPRRQVDTVRGHARPVEHKPRHKTVKAENQKNWHRQQVLITPEQKKWLDKAGFTRGMSDGQIIRELIDNEMMHQQDQELKRFKDKQDRYRR